MEQTDVIYSIVETVGVVVVVMRERAVSLPLASAGSGTVVERRIISVSRIVVVLVIICFGILIRYEGC